MRRVLVTNDDGVNSPGLVVLAKAVLAAGLQPLVAAPLREASGTSASMQAVEQEGRIVVHNWPLPELPGVTSYGVESHPAFIVFAACRGAFNGPPDLVVSGINRGANIGHAVLHSGTVGAALTAGINQVRALAVSLDMADQDPNPHWDTAQSLVEQVLPLVQATEPGTVLNLNVPNLPLEQVRELRRARLSRFGIVQFGVEELTDGWLRMTLTENTRELEAGTDAALLAAGHATITALKSVNEASLATLPESIPLTHG